MRKKYSYNVCCAPYHGDKLVLECDNSRIVFDFMSNNLSCYTSTNNKKLFYSILCCLCRRHRLSIKIKGDEAVSVSKRKGTNFV